MSYDKRATLIGGIDMIKQYRPEPTFMYEWLGPELDTLIEFADNCGASWPQIIKMLRMKIEEKDVIIIES